MRLFTFGVLRRPFQTNILNQSKKTFKLFNAHDYPGNPHLQMYEITNFLKNKSNFQEKKIEKSILKLQKNIYYFDDYKFLNLKLAEMISKLNESLKLDEEILKQKPLAFEAYKNLFIEFVYVAESEEDLNLIFQFLQM